MPLVELEWNWVYVGIVSIVAIFVIGMTSDMIANWKDKKISDARALILGTGIFGLILLFLTVDFKITVLIGLILANTILAGLMAVDNRFTTSDKPWELYVMLFFSLAILIGSIVWVYYNTGLGEAIRSKFNKDKLYEDENGNMVYVDSKNNEVTVVDEYNRAKTYKKNSRDSPNVFHDAEDDSPNVFFDAEEYPDEDDGVSDKRILNEYAMRAAGIAGRRLAEKKRIDAIRKVQAQLEKKS